MDKMDKMDKINRENFPCRFCNGTGIELNPTEEITKQYVESTGDNAGPIPCQNCYGNGIDNDEYYEDYDRRNKIK